MPRSFIDRLGSSDDDSVRGFERAAIRRLLDAEALRRLDRRMAAIYLYGYSVEMWIKAAYFRTVFLVSGLPPTSPIDFHRRKAAVDEWQALGLPQKPVPHDIAGWAQLLVAKRISLDVAYPVSLSNEIADRATTVYLNWREYMRYRSITVNLSALSSVQAEANWFRSKYPQL
jgi:hypothetical protein